MPESPSQRRDWHVPAEQIPLMLLNGYVRQTADGYEMTEAGAAHVLDYCKRQEADHAR